MTYAVLLMPAAHARIEEQAAYIARQQDAPELAAQWLRRVLDAGDSLAKMPRRCRLAQEDRFRSYEVRQLRVGQFLLLFTIVEDDKEVWVLNARHGRRLQRSHELPDTLDDLND